MPDNILFKVSLAEDYFHSSKEEIIEEDVKEKLIGLSRNFVLFSLQTCAVSRELLGSKCLFTSVS